MLSTLTLAASIDCDRAIRTGLSGEAGFWLAEGLIGPSRLCREGKELGPGAALEEAAGMSALSASEAHGMSVLQGSGAEFVSSADGLASAANWLSLMGFDASELILKGFAEESVAGPVESAGAGVAKGLSKPEGGVAASADIWSCAANAPSIGVEKSEAASDTGAGASAEGTILAGASDAKGSNEGAPTCGAPRADAATLSGNGFDWNGSKADKASAVSLAICCC